MRTRRSASLAALIGLIAALGIAELVLRLTGTLATYHETNLGGYDTYYGKRHPTWFHTYSPSGESSYERPEFDFAIKTNSLGVRDVEHQVEKPPGRFRIVALGDSFTEGVGAAFEDGWFKQLERKLQKRGYPVDFIGGGVSGSDALYALTLLEHKLLVYRPDLVILALNATDVADNLMRGGQERFLADGTVRFRDPPSFHTLYRYSHLTRLVVHRILGYEYTLIHPDDKPRLEDEARESIIASIERMQLLGRAGGFRLLVVVHPTSGEVASSWEGAFPDFFFSRLEALGVPNAKLHDAMRAQLAGKPLEAYGWPIDCHFKAAGYTVFADAVEAVLLDQRLLPDRPDTSPSSPTEEP